MGPLRLAHGDPHAAPDLASVLVQWTVDPLVWAGVGLAGLLYAAGVRRTRGWPRARTICVSAGMAVLLAALAGPPAVYSHDLFWVHMVQHLAITLVAAPLIVFGAPVTLALRAAPRWLRGPLLRSLHSRPARLLGHPLVAWSLFGIVMWASHYSSFYDAALESAGVHAVEHAAYLSVSLLFWVPLAGVDPVPRLSRPLRVIYLLAALPVQSFLGLAVYSAGQPMYEHYETLQRSWGPSAMADQELAGIVMWIAGDALLLAWVGAAIAGWMRAETREEARSDRRTGS